MRSLIAVLLLLPGVAQAHHPSGGGAAGFDSPGSALSQPTTSITAGSSARFLPDAKGDRVYLANSVAGSVAFRHRFAFEASVPFSFGGETAHDPGWSLGSSSLGVRALVLPGRGPTAPRITLGASFAFPGTIEGQLQPAGTTALRAFGAVTGHSRILSGGGEFAIAPGFGEGASSFLEGAGFVGLTPIDRLDIRVESRIRGAFEGPLSERTLPLSVGLSGSLSLQAAERLGFSVTGGGTLLTGFAAAGQVGFSMTIDLGARGEDHGDACSCEVPEGDVPSM